MPIASAISRLPHLPPPVLTVYLDTDPGNARNQNTPRGYEIWLKSAARQLAEDLDQGTRKELRRELKKIEDFLETNPIRSRGAALFSGPDVWEAVRLQVPVREEMHWGKPSLEQMAWILDEHRPRGAVLMDGEGAGFYRFWLGQVTQDREFSFSIDRTAWRKRHLAGPATPVVAKQWGVHRDRAADREQAQRDRFAADVARRITRWSRREQLSPIALAGEPKLIEAVDASLPQAVRAAILPLPKVLARNSLSDVQRELAPMLREWERDYERGVVDRLLSFDDPERAALGIDQTLHQLQRGRMRELVIARGLKGSARQCVNCGWVSLSADRTCPLCGGPRRTRTLRTVIPELAGAFGVPIEVVDGEAGDKLRSTGEIGGWLGARKKPVRTMTVTPAEARHAGK